MKLIIEAWQEFLNEKLMLKPGEKGWDKYAELVANAYFAAPNFEKRAVPHYEALIPFVNKMFKRIQSRVKIEPVDHHPYENAEHLRQSVKETGVLKVATIDSEHEVFDLGNKHQVPRCTRLYGAHPSNWFTRNRVYSARRNCFL